MSERVRIRKVRMSIRPIPCSECGKMSNPLSLYRGFFTGWAFGRGGGWYHRDCLRAADYRAALDILIAASGGVQ